MTAWEWLAVGLVAGDGSLYAVAVLVMLRRARRDPAGRHHITD